MRCPLLLLTTLLLAAGCWGPLPTGTDSGRTSAPRVVPTTTALATAETKPDTQPAKDDDEAGRLLTDRHKARALAAKNDSEFFQAAAGLASPRCYTIGGKQVLCDLAGQQAKALAAEKLSKAAYVQGRDRLLAVIQCIQAGDRDARTVPGLVRILQDEDASQRLEAVTHLESLGALAKDALPALQKLKTDPSDMVAVAAIEAIKKIEAPKK